MANKKPLKIVTDTVETLNRAPILGDVTQSFRKDLAQAGAKDFWDQILGNYEKKGSNGHEKTMKPGEEYNLKAQGQEHKKPEKPVKADAAPAIDYHRDIVRSGERLATGERQEMQYKIQEILSEIQKLVSTSTVLESEFKEVQMTQAPKNAGKYHLNFFDWMLSVIKLARMKVEDGSAWLNTIKGKKGKNGYWNMFKKHGTSFGMSNERSVATQTG
jgi:hypothetical protein